MYEIISGVWDDDKDDWNQQAYDGLESHIFETLLEAVTAVTSDVDDDDRIEINMRGDGSYVGILITKLNGTQWSYEIIKNN